MTPDQVENIDAQIGYTKAAIRGVHAFFRGVYADAEASPEDMDTAALAELFVEEDRALIAQAETILAQSRVRLRTLRRVRATGRLSIYDLILLEADGR
jgi:hypothetical protein